MDVRIGFLHTAEAHVATFDRVVAQADAPVETTHLVDEDLLRKARSLGVNHEAVRTAVGAALAQLVDDGAGVVVCTCSTIAAIVESAEGIGVPVLRVDRPMAASAVASAERIAVVAALESTLEPTAALLTDECERQHRWPVITLSPCLSAWDFWEAGDVDGYCRAVAEHVNALDVSFDVVVLAQASMLGAVQVIGDRPGRSVLASPSSAVTAALRSVTHLEPASEDSESSERQRVARSTASPRGES